MVTFKDIQFTDNGAKEFDRIMVTLGVKTKKLFIEAIKAEYEETRTKDHQMLLNADVIRIAQKLKLLN